MEIYTVSMFGHRKINRHYEVEAILEEIITDLVTDKNYVKFLVGRDGEFDLLAASAVCQVKRKKGFKNSSLILVLPCATKHFLDNEKSYLEYYDDVEIFSRSEEKHIREAFRFRNKYMVDRSDMVICYAERNKDDAFLAKKYAERSGKEVVEVTNFWHTENIP